MFSRFILPTPHPSPPPLCSPGLLSEHGSSDLILLFQYVLAVRGLGSSFTEDHHCCAGIALCLSVALGSTGTLTRLILLTTGAFLVLFLKVFLCISVVLCMCLLLPCLYFPKVFHYFVCYYYCKWGYCFRFFFKLFLAGLWKDIADWPMWVDLR